MYIYISKKLVQLRISQSDIKVAELITHLVCSKDFANHDPNKFSDSGVGLEEENSEDFEDIFAAAQDCATPVTAEGNVGAVASIAEKTHRKKKTKTPRLNKQQRIEKFFYQEKSDEKGVEKEYVRSKEDLTYLLTI